MTGRRWPLAVALACLTLSGCGIHKELTIDGPTGLSLSALESIFPPGASKVRKEKDSWYSFERNGKKFLLYYSGSSGSIQIFEE